jgi:hypothetical protein
MLRTAIFATLKPEKVVDCRRAKMVWEVAGSSAFHLDYQDVTAWPTVKPQSMSVVCVVAMGSPAPNVTAWPTVEPHLTPAVSVVAMGSPASDVTA